MDGRFVSYLRVSTQKQGESGLGLEAQRRVVAGYLNGGAWELLEEFQEVESGRKSNRPKLREAIELCQLTGATLLIANISRLTRNLRFLTGLQESGIEFIACDMPKANNLTVSILVAVAQYEAEQTGLRTKASLASIKARIKSGEGHVSRRSGRAISRLGNPNGLSVSRPDLGVEGIKAKADSYAARVLPRVRRLQKENSSLTWIAAQLAASKIMMPRGGTAWTATAVKRVLDRTPMN
jgi:DNA invertase Pin-like site-specific DNA recombinase